MKKTNDPPEEWEAELYCKSCKHQWWVPAHLPALCPHCHTRNWEVVGRRPASSRESAEQLSEANEAAWRAAIPQDEHINDYRQRYGLEPYPTKETVPWSEWRAAYLQLLAYWIATHDNRPGETTELDLLVWLNENAAAASSRESADLDGPGKPALAPSAEASEPL